MLALLTSPATGFGILEGCLTQTQMVGAGRKPTGPRNSFRVKMIRFVVVLNFNKLKYSTVNSPYKRIFINKKALDRFV